MMDLGRVNVVRDFDATDGGINTCTFGSVRALSAMLIHESEVGGYSVRTAGLVLPLCDQTYIYHHMTVLQGKI